MKSLIHNHLHLTLFFIFLFITSGIAQTFPQKEVQKVPLEKQSENSIKGCGTRITPAQIEMELKRGPDYLQKAQRLMARRGFGDNNIRIQIHIIRRDDGSGGINIATVRNEIENFVNPYFDPINVNFFECGPEMYHNSSQYYILTSQSEGDDMANLYNVTDVINIYFVGDYKSSGSSRCGYSNFPASLPDDYIVIHNGCADNGATVAHEIGHYFDLYHTHETAFGLENVTRNSGDACYNCLTTGDILCDTDADSSASLSGKVDFNCNLIPPIGADACGINYTPNPRNIMSYARAQCKDYFSPGQYARMNAAVVGSRSYLLTDNIEPVAICKNDVTVYVDEHGYAEVSASEVDNGSFDDCAFTTFLSDSIFSCDDLGVNYEFLVVVDAAGNYSSCFTNITVLDTIAPEIVAQPPDITLQCDETYIPPNVETLFMDNCDDELFIIGDIFAPRNICGYPLRKEYYFEAHDDSGNFTSIFWTVTFIDTIAPIASDIPQDVTLQCDDAAGIAAAEAMQPTFTDNCNPQDSLHIYAISSILPDPDCPNAYLIDRSWYAEDPCGNRSITVSQTITVIDTIAPIASNLPSDVTLQCDDAAGIAAALAMEPTFTDNCSPQPSLIIYPISALSPDPNCPNAYFIDRSWYADDGCGNLSVTVSQTITVIDTEQPDITGCPDLSETIECNAAQNEAIADQWDADNIAILEGCAQDNCTTDFTGLVASDYDFNNLNGSCGATGTLEVKYTIDDGCGNLSYVYATLTIVDTTPPQVDWNNPLINGQGDNAYLAVECESQLPEWEYPVFDISDVIATDLCGGVKMDFSSTHIEGNCPVDGYMRRFEYKWTATDECGNSSSLTLVVEIIDTQAPELYGIPDDITLTCGQEAFMPEVGFCQSENEGKVTFYDICECADIVIEVDTFYGNCTGEYQIFRRWVASDKCGNSTSADQIVTYLDEVGPVIKPNYPKFVGSHDGGTIYLECNHYYEPEWIKGINAGSMSYSDNCSSPYEIGRDFIMTETLLNSNCDNGEIKRYRLEWFASDDCGNMSDYALNVVIVDHTPPTILGVGVSTCTSIDPMQGISAVDNCALARLYYEDEPVFNECLNAEIIRRTFYARDFCGNIATKTQLVYPQALPIEVEFIVNENQGWKLGDTLRVACVDGLPDIQASDVQVQTLCPGVSIQHKLTQISDCSIGSARILQHRWIASTGCGEVAASSVYIAVIDTIAPVIHIEKDAIVTSCDNIPLPEVLDCSEVNLSVKIDTLQFNCASDMVLLLQYTAVDTCGNTTVDTQYVKIESNLEFRNVPDNSCGPIDDILVQAYDHCSDTLVQVSHLIDDPDTCSPGIVRIRHTWIAQNACGDKDSVIRYATLGDDLPPDIVKSQGSAITVPFGGVIEISCGDPLPDFNAQAVIATDNCGSARVDFRSSYLSGDCINQVAEAIRFYWEASDICGNKKLVYVDVHRIDGQRPEIYNVPDDEFIYCGELLPPPDNITAVDLCSGILDIDYKQVIEHQEGITLVHRYWTAVDDCNNAALKSQTITINREDDFTIQIRGDQAVNCNDKGIPYHVNIEGGYPQYHYEWSVVSGLCKIVSGKYEQDVVIQMGFSNTVLKVQVRDGHGCMQEDVIQIQCTTEESENPFHTRITETDELNIHLYPNPTAGRFTLTASVRSQKVLYELYTINGELIESRQIKTESGKLLFTESVSNLNSGVYVVKIKDGNDRIAYERLVVIQ